MDIIEPTLLLDEQKCRQNIRKMVEKAHQHQLNLRPHFKTHQSHEIGRWFREAGVKSITVSSVKMASYFAQDHWTDITIAFPVNLLEIGRINTLANQVNLNLLVESEEVIQKLSQKLTTKVGVFIKIDVGANRTGVHPDHESVIQKLIAQIDGAHFLEFRGFLAHAGHSYRARSQEEIRHVHLGSIQLMRKLKAKFKATHPNLLLSVGDTPTCSVAQDFSGIDEIRPGNFVFYDAMQQQIGSCQFSEIAVAMACPIVALHPERGELVIYGGGVHFSKDHTQADRVGTHYGLVVQKDNGKWGEPLEQVFVHRLSQEHGIVKAPSDFIAQQSVGDLLYILPVHSCMTANLMKSYQTLTHQRIKMMT